MVVQHVHALGNTRGPVFHVTEDRRAGNTGSMAGEAGLVVDLRSRKLCRHRLGLGRRRKELGFGLFPGQVGATDRLDAFGDRGPELLAFPRVDILGPVRQPECQNQDGEGEYDQYADNERIQVKEFLVAAQGITPGCSGDAARSPRRALYNSGDGRIPSEWSQAYAGALGRRFTCGW